MNAPLPLLRVFCRRLGGHTVLDGQRESLADFHQDPLEHPDLGARDADGRSSIDFLRGREQQFTQRPCRLIETDIRLAVIVRSLHASNQATLLHRVRGSEGGRLARPNARAELHWLGPSSSHKPREKHQIPSVMT